MNKYNKGLRDDITSAIVITLFIITIVVFVTMLFSG